MIDAGINHILFCDESNTEDALTLDEDIYFLKDDITRMEANSNAGDINVVIDPPNDAMIPVDNIGESSGVHVLQSSEVPTRFTWKTVTSENTQHLCVKQILALNIKRCSYLPAMIQSPMKYFKR